MSDVRPMNYCPYCEKQIDVDAVDCAHCGSSVKPKNRDIGAKDDGILAIVIYVLLLGGAASYVLALLSINTLVMKIFLATNVVCAILAYVFATGGRKTAAVLCALAPVPLSFAIVLGISHIAQITKHAA